MADFSITLTPRFYETDALGHINNVAITAWFEVARVRLLEQLGAHEHAPTDWVLAGIQMDYVDETFYGQDVQVRIVAISVGNTSLTICCEMYQGERLTVKGKAVLVHIDLETKTKLRIGDPLREAIGKL